MFTWKQSEAERRASSTPRPDTAPRLHAQTKPNQAPSPPRPPGSPSSLSLQSSLPLRACIRYLRLPAQPTLQSFCGCEVDGLLAGSLFRSNGYGECSEVVYGPQIACSWYPLGDLIVGLICL